MTIKDRINTIIEVKGLSKAAFERRCGLSNGFINNIVKGVGNDKIESILRAFPDIDRIWLLTGEGDMFASGGTNIGGNSTTIGDISGMTGSPITINANAELESMRKTIEALQEQNRSLTEQNRTLTEIIKNLTLK